MGMLNILGAQGVHSIQMFNAIQKTCILLNQTPVDWSEVEKKSQHRLVLVKEYFWSNYIEFSRAQAAGIF
jgi:hypothetical protein